MPVERGVLPAEALAGATPGGITGPGTRMMGAMMASISKRSGA